MNDSYVNTLSADEEKGNGAKTHAFEAVNPDYGDVLYDMIYRVDCMPDGEFNHGMIASSINWKNDETMFEKERVSNGICKYRS